MYLIVKHHHVGDIKFNTWMLKKNLPLFSYWSSDQLKAAWNVRHGMMFFKSVL